MADYNYELLVSNYLSTDYESQSTAKGRMSFKGNILYSYQSKLFKRIVPNVYILDKGISHYSVTSAKHTSKALQQMPNDVVIYRTYIDNSVEQNVLCYVADIKYFISKFKRARKTKLGHQLIIRKLYAEVQSYMDFYKFDKRTTAYKQFKQLFAIMFEAKVI